MSSRTELQKITVAEQHIIDTQPDFNRGPTLGPLKGNSSDGDSRRRTLHLGQNCDIVGGERFKPVSVEDGFLFSAKVEGGVVCNMSDQDYIHNHKKADRHLDHTSIELSIGTYVINRNILK